MHLVDAQDLGEPPRQLALYLVHLDVCGDCLQINLILVSRVNIGYCDKSPIVAVLTYNSRASSWTWVGLTLIWVFHPSRLVSDHRLNRLIDFKSMTYLKILVGRLQNLDWQPKLLNIGPFGL